VEFLPVKGTSPSICLILRGAAAGRASRAGTSGIALQAPDDEASCYDSDANHDQQQEDPLLTSRRRDRSLAYLRRNATRARGSFGLPATYPHRYDVDLSLWELPKHSLPPAEVHRGAPPARPCSGQPTDFAKRAP
jgi:hypothetical protein